MSKPGLAYVQRGTLYAYTGRPNEALEQLEHAMRLSPFDRQKFNFLGEIAISALLAGKNELAGKTAQQTLMLRPSYWYAHMIKVLAYSRSGNQAAARAAIQQLFEHRPDFSSVFIRWLPFADPAVSECFIDEMRAISGPLENVSFQ